MKGLSKVMMGASVGALALTVFSGVSAEAAVTITPSKTLTGVEKGYSVSFDAINAKKGIYNAKAKWDLYEKASTVDLSNLKTAKDTYIAVKDAAAKTTIYKIAADTQKKFKATCDGTSIKIEVDKKEVTGEALERYSFRTENSAWTKFDKTNGAGDLTPYTMQGATLYIRYTGAKDTVETKEGATEIDVAGTKVKVTDVAVNSFYGKEFKVKIPKRANAPAISVDYVNGVVKKNKKVVYAIGDDTSKAIDAVVSTASPAPAMADNVSIDNSKAGVIAVQIPKTDKKAASKIATFSWPASSAKPTVDDSKKPQLTSDKTKIENATGNIITDKLTYEMKDNANVAKSTYTITNKATDVTYDVYTSKTENSKEVADKKVATLKPGAKVVLTSKKCADGTKLIVRVAGDKKAMTLPSPFSDKAATVVYLATPAAPTATPGA